MTLLRGDEVIVTQSLGGSFTVQTSDGYLARLSTEDADALGLEPTGEQPGPTRARPRPARSISRR